MTVDEIIKHCDDYITSMNKYVDTGNIGWWLEFYHTVLNGFRELKALEAQPTDAVKCNCITEEIAKSFTEDVEAVKDKLPKSSEDCRNCKKWNECPCGKEGHENGTSIGYSIGECKDYEPCEDAISRQAVLKELGSEPMCWTDSDAEIQEINDYRWFKKIIETAKPVKLKYTDEEIDKAQAVEQAYVDKMVELAVEEIKRPKGKWIKIQSGDEDFPESIVCSRCKGENSHIDFNEHGEPIGKIFVMSKYCPNCGAYMSGGEGDEINN